MRGCAESKPATTSCTRTSKRWIKGRPDARVRYKGAGSESEARHKDLESGSEKDRSCISPEDGARGKGELAQTRELRCRYCDTDEVIIKAAVLASSEYRTERRSRPAALNSIQTVAYVLTLALRASSWICADL